LPKSRRADLLDVETVRNVLAFCSEQRRVIVQNGSSKRSERIGEVFGTFGLFVGTEREKQGAAAITAL
jgi:hypothetical protein